MNEATVGVNFVANVGDALSKFDSLGGSVLRLTNIFKSFGAVAGAIFVGRKVVSGLRSIIGVGKRSEYQLLQLKTTMFELGNAATVAALAQREFNAAVLFAAKTPFNVDQVVDGAIRIRALGIEPLTESFTDLRGKSTSAMKILGNAAGATGADFNELVHGFGSATQGFLRSLAFQTKMPLIEIRQQLVGLTKGTHEYKMKLIEILSQVPRFQTGMELAARSMTGIVSNLEDAWENFLRTIAGTEDRGKRAFSFFGIVKQQFVDFQKYIERDDIAATILGIAKVLSLGFRTVVAIFKTLLWPVIQMTISLFKTLRVQIGIPFQTGAVKAKTFLEALRQLEVRLSEVFDFIQKEILNRLIVFFILIQDFLSMILAEIGVNFGDLIKALTVIISSKLLLWVIKLISKISLLSIALKLLYNTGLVMLISAIVSIIKNGPSLNSILLATAGVILTIAINATRLAQALKFAAAAKEFFRSTDLVPSTATLVGSMGALIGALVAMGVGIAGLINEGVTLNNVLLTMAPLFLSLALSGPKLVGIVLGMGKAFIFLGRAIRLVSAFSLALAGSPIGLVIAGIATVVVAIVLLVKHWDLVVSWVKKAWNWIVQLGQAIWDWAVGAIQKLIDLIPEAVNWFVNFWKESSLLTKALIVLGAVILAPIASIAALVAAVVWLASNWNTVMSAIGAAWNGLINSIRDAWNAFIGFFVDAWDGFIDFFRGAWNGFIISIRESWNGLPSWFKGIVLLFLIPFYFFYKVIKKIVTSIVSIFPEKFHTVLGFLENIWGSIIDFFKGTWDEMISYILGLGSNFVSIFNRLVAPVKQLFYTIWDVLTSGFKRAFDWISSKIDTFVGNAKREYNAIKKLFFGDDKSSKNVGSIENSGEGKVNNVIKGIKNNSVGSNFNQNNNVKINVYQKDGENSEDFANRVAHKVSKTRNSKAQQLRQSMSTGGRLVG